MPAHNRHKVFVQPSLIFLLLFVYPQVRTASFKGRETNQSYFVVARVEGEPSVYGAGMKIVTRQKNELMDMVFSADKAVEVRSK